MAVTKITRLNKAAREFNVGTGTIVDFLRRKGYEIDENPNAKLTAEMYDLLTNEYSGEKTVKEEARKKGLGAVKRETISIEDRKKTAIEPEDEDEDTEIIIRGVSVEVDEEFKKSVEPHLDQVQVREQEKTDDTADDVEESIEQLRIEAIEEDQPAEQPLDEKVIVDTESPEDRKEPVEVPKDPDRITVQKKDEAEAAGKVEKELEREEEVETPLPGPEVKAEEDIRKPEAEEEKKEEKILEKVPEEKAEEKVAAVEKEEKPAEAAKEEKKSEGEDKPAEKGGLRVLGKVDLSTINEKTKPARKSAAEKRKEREERWKADKAKTVKDKEKPAEKPEAKPKAEEKPAEQKKQPEPKVDQAPSVPNKEQEPKDENFIRTRVEKLQGPNIIGKIELPVERKSEKKKPVASSSDDKVKLKKKKRKRIKKEQTDQKQVEAKKQRDDKSKVKARQRGKKRHEEKVEPSEEEIQKQIKETLARLSGTGKSKASKHRRQKRDQIHKQMEKEMQEQEEGKHTIKVTEFVTANELASLMNVPVTEVISMCMQLGLFVSINQRLDAETIALVAEEFGFKVEFASVETTIDQAEEEEDKPEDLEPRTPIVTVMGHVDHGKTKLLDYIRHTNVIAGEAGGITQHIGAYEVTLDNDKKITFLDTPGHEAFTAMRARGAKVTDIAIIVIAADDSVMPQTKEAINHALAANVPIVFAINKIDKPTSNTERIKEQLSQMNILVEDWGGKYQSQEISAKAGLNIDELLEKVLLEAELLDLHANPSRRAQGTVIESSLDKGRGYVAKLLVQNGTLKIGDVVLAGSHAGRVKAMYNERNQAIKEAGPSSPVLMLGMNSAPQAGDTFKVMADEREAKNIATKRQQLQREQGLRTQKHITLDEIGRRIAIGDFRELNIIVKGDVDGSVEALSDSLLKLSTEEVQVNVIHKSVGQVTETDVMLASASNAIIVAFQVRPSVGARRLAEKEQIDIRLYSIIYAAIEEIKSAIEGMLSPDIEEKITCNIEVRDTFKITKVGTIAGCMVLDGTITRNTNVRIIRDGIVIYTGKLGSLKRFKDDVKEVHAGYECGLNIENFNDIKVGDIIEGFEEVQVARKLEK
ncbi:MAG: translation initiation factor IF-2 [Bacteroidales bacterium]